MTALSLTQQIVDDYVSSLEEERKPDGYWHPSSLFTCARRAVYEFLGVEKPPVDARGKRIFRLGHILHEFIQTAFGRAASLGDQALFYPEVALVDEARKIKGHADGLSVSLADGEVLEIKTIGTYGYKSLTEPKPEHKQQAKLYVQILRRYGGTFEFQPEGGGVIEIPPMPNLKKVRFAYVSKDNLEIKEYVEEFTEEDDEELDAYLARLDLHVFEGTLPKRLIQLTPTGKVSKQRPWECGYCPFADRCYSSREPAGIN